MKMAAGAAAVGLDQLVGHWAFIFTAYALASDHQQMSPAAQSLLWTASSEAVGDELDLHITVGHPPGRLLSSRSAAVIFLGVAVVKPDSRRNAPPRQP